ncbi:MAG: lipopolysaccharide heptosyltransferase II [Acidaminococcaceae bacterium]|nr:lipopolysaccharide heptosyltransferase II [Acidaminococcaceae bacterium]
MEYKNILLIKMSSLGDILHTLPFAAALRQRFPQAKITWLVHPQFAGFVPDPPVIDEIIYFDKVKFNKMSLLDKLAYFLEMRRLLHSKKFDLVIDMQGLFKSAVLAAISGCPDRISYCEMREGSGLVSKAICGSHSRDHVIERYLDVARYLGAEVKEITFSVPDLDKETLSAQKKLQDRGLQGDYIVMVPGARWKTKEWPAEHYASLAKMIIADGLAVVLAGGADDTAKGAKITALAGNPAQLINLIGQTSLRELAALIKGCRIYISADTGPLHFAAALKKPLITMYGPTKADRTGPYGSDDATVILSPAACAGCLKKECDDWHCMYAITPEMVYAAYAEKIRRL